MILDLDTSNIIIIICLIIFTVVAPSLIQGDMDDSKYYLIPLSVFMYFVVLNFYKTDWPSIADTEYTLNRTKYRKEPYIVPYKNPYMSNLKQIDFNFRNLYNDGNDIGFYLKNKVNELLIGKYVKFYKVLCFKQEGQPIKIIYDKTIVLSEQDKLKEHGQKCRGFNLLPNSSNTQKIDASNQVIIWATQNIFEIPSKGYNSDGISINNSSPADQFLYIFEKNDLNKYKVRNTLSIIKNNSTIINTNELSSDIQYVYYLGTKLNIDSTIIDSNTPSATTAPVPTSAAGPMNITINSMKPFIVLFRNNVKRPIYYRNTQGALEHKNYTTWLLDTYKNFINTQFKYRTFKIIGQYNKFNIANSTITLANFDSSSNWNTSELKNLEFDSNIYKDYLYNRGLVSQASDMGFVIVIKNITLPKDVNNSEIGYIDANNRSLVNKILPYLEVYYVSKANENNYSSSNKIDIKLFERQYSTSFNDNILINFNIRDNNSEILKINRNNFNDQINKMNNNRLLPTNIGNSDSDKFMYVTDSFVNIKNIKDYTIKMKLIADAILDRYHSDRIKSINNYSYNLDDLNGSKSCIIKIEKKNNYYYYGNNKQLNLSNTVNLNTYNINKYPDIKDLRKDFISWLDREINNSGIWTYPIGGFRSLEHILEVINKKIYDSRSVRLPMNISANRDTGSVITTTKTTINTNTNNLGSLDFFKITKNFEITDILNNVNFLKLENSTRRYNILPIFRYNSNYVQIIDKYINETTSKLDSITTLTSSYSNIYNYDANIEIIESLENRIEHIHLIKDKSNIFIVEYRGDTNSEDSLSKLFELKKKIKCISFSGDTGSALTSVDTTKLQRPDSTVLDENIMFDKCYLNITANGNPSMISYYDSNGIENINISSLEGPLPNSKYLVLYSMDKIKSTVSINTKIEIKKSNIDTKVYIDDKSDNEILQISTKTYVNNIGNTVSYKYLKHKYAIANFYSNKMGNPERNDIDNIVNLNRPGRFSEDENIPTVEYVFEGGIPNTVNLSDDANGKKFVALKQNIYWNESLKIYYNIPNDIGINTSPSSFQQLRYSNEIFIPYKLRNQFISNSYVVDTDKLCQINSTIKFNSIKTTSKNKLFSKGDYTQFYTNILKNIIGVYSEINKNCNLFYSSNNKVMPRIPQSMFNYIKFDKDILYYRNDESLTKDSAILKTELNKPVIINNDIFSSDVINVSSSNRLNTDKIQKYLMAVINQKKIGYGGYNYDIAEDICKRIFTVEKKNCVVPEYKDNKPEDNKTRNKCFETVVNTFTKDEENKQRNEKQWIFSENNDDRSNLNSKYNNLELKSHRIAQFGDIASGFWYEYDWLKLNTKGLTGWVDKNDNKIGNNSNLIKPNYNKDNKSVSSILSIENYDSVNNKNVFCYGVKPNRDELISQAEKLEKFNQKMILQHMNDMRENDFADFNNAKKSYENDNF